MVWVWVTAAATALGVVDALSFSRRAAASITQVAGVSAGAPGALPADGLQSGAIKLPTAVATSLSGFGGAAVAGGAASLVAPTGSDNRIAAAPEVSAGDAFFVTADGAGVERASLSAAV